MSTYLIAEMGSTWLFGSKPTTAAKTLINRSADAGANAVKVQWTSDPRLMEQRRHVAPGTYERLAFPCWWLTELKHQADAHGIDFLCTVFVPQDVGTIDPLVPRFKLASLEYRDAAMWQAMSVLDKPILASVGTMTEDEIEAMGPYWSPKTTLLQCTAAYPCPMEQLQLRLVPSPCLGFSDHSARLQTGAWAVMRGATVVEVHVRHSRTPQDNPDYGHSLGPEQFQQYAANIRQAERALGAGRKVVQPAEHFMRQHQVVT